MEKRVRKWLYDILLVIEEVEGYVGNLEGGYEAFQRDILLCRAVERSFEIIGEAMSRILKANTSILISNAEKFIGARNIISHGYDIVDYATLWAAIHKDLPVLKKEVEQLLNLK